MPLTMPEKQKTSPRRAGIVIAALAVLAIAGGVLWHVTGRLNFDGELQSALVPLVAKRGGAVVSVDARNGESVRKGQILVRFDAVAARQRLQAEQEKLAQMELLLPPAHILVPSPGAASVESLTERHKRQVAEEAAAKGRLMAASDREAEASVTYNRISALVSGGKMNPQDKAHAEAALESARWQRAEAAAQFETLSLDRAATEREIRKLREAQASAGADAIPADKRLQAVELQRQRVAEAAAAMQEASVIAPEDGIVLAVLVQPGSNVSAAQPCVYFHPAGQGYEVAALVTAKEGARLEPGQRCSVRFSTGASREEEGYISRLGPGRLLEGRLASPTVADPRAVAVWVAIPQTAADLSAVAMQAGAQAEVTVHLRESLIDGEKAGDRAASPKPPLDEGLAAAQAPAAEAAPPTPPLSVQTPFGPKPEAETPPPVRPEPPVVKAGSPEAAGRAAPPQGSQKAPETSVPQLPPMRPPAKPGSPLPDPRNNPSLARPEVLERADDPAWGRP